MAELVQLSLVVCLRSSAESKLVPGLRSSSACESFRQSLNSMFKERKPHRFTVRNQQPGRVEQAAGDARFHHKHRSAPRCHNNDDTPDFNAAGLFDVLSMRRNVCANAREIQSSIVRGKLSNIVKNPFNSIKERLVPF